MTKKEIITSTVQLIELRNEEIALIVGGEAEPDQSGSSIVYVFCGQNDSDSFVDYPELDPIGPDEYNSIMSSGMTGPG